MTRKTLTEEQLTLLRPLEKSLQQAVQSADPDRALSLATEIQKLFDDRKHHRLLQAKLWAYEACIDANRLAFAEAGLVGVRELASGNTRIYLEATSLLAVCKLRNRKIGDAKPLVKEVLAKINNIRFDVTRHRFQKSMIERIEEECILAGLIGTDAETLDTASIQQSAVYLLRHKSDEEIYALIGNNIPAGSADLLGTVRSFSIAQIAAPDRLLLAAPEKATRPEQMGRTTFALLRRVAWKTFCKPSSPIYKLWSKRVPKVFNENYFSAAIATTMADFKIGVPLIASGIVALIMKYSAEEFCELSKPKSLMSERSRKQN